MKNKLIDNFIDSFKSVMPIAIVIMVISFIIDIPNLTIRSFAFSSILLIFGITFFTTGADISMISIGESIGNSLVKKGNKVLILLVSFILGMVITVAEPDLLVLATELTSIPNYLVILAVSLGVGLFLLIGVFRILKKFSYRTIVSVTLCLIFLLLFFTQSEFVSIAFDGGGVTTGSMGVPLIVAFGYGITKIRNDENAKSDSFGLCGLASLGPIVIILLVGLFFKMENSFDTNSFVGSVDIAKRFSTALISSFKEVGMSLIPVLVVFGLSQFFGKKFSKRTFIQIIVGLILSVIGLTIFLTGVSAGFLETGYIIGNTIAGSSSKYLLIPVGMIIGYIIIQAEPAIKILNRQISNLTEGSISEKIINSCLSIGVCLAIGLSLLRVFFAIPMIYIIVPGYFIAGLLMYFTPSTFVTIAYDSGGAASGVMTTSFLLPLCIGASEVLEGNILVDAFGVGAMVSLTPIIIIQLLGILYQRKLQRRKSGSFNEEIIDFSWEAL